MTIFEENLPATSKQKRKLQCMNPMLIVLVKGNIRKRYKSGSLAFHGNPFDGHKFGKTLEQVVKLNRNLYIEEVLEK